MIIHFSINKDMSLGTIFVSILKERQKTYFIKKIKSEKSPYLL